MDTQPLLPSSPIAPILRNAERPIDISGQVGDSLLTVILNQYSEPVCCASLGEVWLDVGCGTGEMTLALASVVGPTGKVIGIDIDALQVRRARVHNQLSTVEFLEGDAHRLPFDDATFDGCRADRVFQHLSCRKWALDDMIRVTQPRGWICVADPDWDTLVIDSPYRETTRKIIAHLSNSIGNGWSGRQLPRLFKQAALTELVIVPGSLCLTDLHMADELYGFRATARQMSMIGALTAREAEEWAASLTQMQTAGMFFCSLTGFSVCARKPS